MTNEKRRKLRQKMAAMVRRGRSVEEVAVEFEVSGRTVENAIRQFSGPHAQARSALRRGK